MTAIASDAPRCASTVRPRSLLGSLDDAAPFDASTLTCMVFETCCLVSRLSVSRDMRQVRRQVQEFDVVITSGGVGPTHDDITINSVARALNQSIQENEVNAADSSRTMSLDLLGRNTLCWRLCPAANAIRSFCSDVLLKFGAAGCEFRLAATFHAPCMGLSCVYSRHSCITSACNKLPGNALQRARTNE